MEPFESYDQLARLAPALAIKFLVAVLCGGAIGMERETTGKPAGLRTNILVCVGSMIFTVMSIEMSRGVGGDPTRIAAQIVAGIGFLGAGAILHQRSNVVKGMTTAAMIWLMAALGMMIGYGYLFSAIALTFASVLMILSLRGMERRIHDRLARDYRVSIPDTPDARRSVMEIIVVYDEYIRRYSIDRGRSGVATLRIVLIGPKEERLALIQALSRIEGANIEERNGKPRR